MLKTADVKTLTTKDLPGKPDLVWGSFPCQDLSLAGGGAGLRGDRSGTFWPFWSLMKSLVQEGRSPKIVVLENVCGTLTSHQGNDFTAICSALEQSHFRCGAIVMDAALFVPQSRPRLFIIGVKKDVPVPLPLIGCGSSPTWHNRTLVSAYDRLPEQVKQNWIWWNFPKPKERTSRLIDLIEENPTGVTWHTPSETQQLLAMMSEINLAKVEEAKRSGRRMVGTIYKRTRHENGFKVQRAEVRFDDVAGCLRTPAGGSSRQLILVVDGRSVRSRLISSRETARLMGLPDSYELPESYNEAYHLTGDGVVVPVVRYLAEKVLEPILQAGKSSARRGKISHMENSRRTDAEIAL